MYGGHFVGWQSGLVNVNSPSSASRGNGDLEVQGGQKTPEPGRRAMAEHCLWARGESGCHQSPVICQHRMSDGVDAAMDDVEPSRFQPTLHDPRPEPAMQKLPAGDEAMLSVREARDQPVNGLKGRLTTYLVVDRPFTGHGRTLASKSAQGCSVRDESPPFYCRFWIY
jgi:hypothetical protein